MEKHKFPIQIVFKKSANQQQKTQQLSNPTKQNSIATYKGDIDWVSIYLPVIWNLHLTSCNTFSLPSVVFSSSTTLFLKETD